MSTNMYLVCLEHEPMITSDNVEHHVSSDILDKIKMWVVDRELYIKAYDVADYYNPDFGDQYHNNAARFMVSHPSCRLALKTEYEEWVDLGMGLPEGVKLYGVEAAPEKSQFVVKLDYLDVFICEYEDRWTDEVGTIPVCKVHNNNSRWGIEYGTHRPCITVDPWPSKE